MGTPRDILEFWFGAQRGVMRDAWFKRDLAFDHECKRRFARDTDRAIDGDFQDWELNANSALALILLLDQLPRNIYRDTPRAFAGDERARHVADESIKRGFDRNRPATERLFFYLPFEHSERFVDQDRCVELMESLGDPELLLFATRHRDIIERFGRFPHRNRVLGRASTPAEMEFLKQPGSSF